MKERSIKLGNTEIAKIQLIIDENVLPGPNQLEIDGEKHYGIIQSAFVTDYEPKKRNLIERMVREEFKLGEDKPVYFFN